MLFNLRALPSTSAAIFIVVSVACMAASSSYEMCSNIRKPPSCDCSNTPDGYQLRCSAFTVQVKPKASVRIQCIAHVVSDFSVLNGIHIGEVDTLIIRQCPLASVSLSQLVENMGVSSVNNVQLIYTGINGNSEFTVTRELFHGLSNVVSLKLHTNGTTILMDDVFIGMHNVTLIDLKSNKLLLGKDIFCGLTKLQVLKLWSYNQAFLEPGIFHSLIHLRILVLSGNMVNVSRSLFSDIKNLESLDIISTKITNLPSDLFVDLPKLRNINLHANEFIRLPQKLFKYNRDLDTINLRDNRRTLNTLPPRMLADLTKLKIVRINNCNMSTLPKDLLWGSASLHTVSLNNNAFITLPETLFKDCTKLETVDISYNRITELPNQIFSNATTLKSLKMNNNRLSVITKNLFLSLRYLVVLDLKDNRLTDIETDAFDMLYYLKAVNLSNNMLTFRETSENGTTGLSPLKHCHVLENIQLANNSLSKIFADWRNLINLKTLNLAYNKISQITAEHLDFIVSNNISINISYNNISQFDIFEAEKIYEYVSGSEIYNVPVRHFFVEGNPIKCDCKEYRFLQYSGKAITAEVKLTIKTNTSSLQCVKPESHSLNLGQGFEKSLIKYFFCLIKVDYSVNCPELCTCMLLKSMKAVVIECYQKNLTSVTTRENVLHNLSRDVFFTERNLDPFDFNANGLIALTPDVFVHLIKLRKISLCANKILRLPQNLFVHNSDLEVINIENNGQTLNTVPSGLLANLTKLKEVRLHNCNISSLPHDLMWGSRSINIISLRNNAFTTLRELLFIRCGELQHLDISFNRITDLPMNLFVNTKNLKTLKINNNHLTLITRFLFSSLEKLEVLDLKYNRLTHIESSAFATLSSLKSVNMSDNMLTFGNKWSSLVNCTNLEDIQLANNSLTNIFSNLQNLENLQTLNLAYNKISQLQMSSDEAMNVTTPPIEEIIQVRKAQCLEILNVSSTPPSGMAHKDCTRNGTWFVHPASGHVWSNYITCVNTDDLNWRQQVNGIYEIGYLISLVALLLSLVILTHFKSLRCPRITLHMNLFTSFAANNALWLLWYTLVVRNPHVILDNRLDCQLLHVVLHYFLLTNYSWMLAHGFYLYTLLVLAFTSEERLVKWLKGLAWTLPALFIIVYTVLRWALGDTVQCWINESPYTNVLIVFVCLSMALNLGFLCNVVRVLLVKQRAGSSHLSNSWSSLNLLQALRATLLLLPLLGLHYLLTPFRPPKDHPWERVYEVTSAITASFQGLCVAMLFCFCNGEVIAQVKRRWQYVTFRPRTNSYTATTVSVRQSVTSTASLTIREENV